MTKEQLSALYSKYGFVATNESGTPMEREPGAKTVPVEVKKTQAEINRERQAEKKTAAVKTKKKQIWYVVYKTGSQANGRVDNVNLNSEQEAKEYLNKTFTSFISLNLLVVV
jgi:hypothetical protein